MLQKFSKNIVIQYESRKKKVALFKLKTQLYTLHENCFLVQLKVVYIESAREKMTNVLFSVYYT